MRSSATSGSGRASGTGRRSSAAASSSASPSPGRSSTTRTSSFADEPTGNLDSKTGAGVMEALIGLVAEKKKSLIVVTHDTKLARLGDRTLELADGRLVA